MRETEGEATALAPDATVVADLVFDLLSDSRRRYALYYLNDQPDGVATIENLTKNVIALERSAGADEETTAKTETVSGHDPGTARRTNERACEWNSSTSTFRNSRTRESSNRIHGARRFDNGASRRSRSGSSMHSTKETA